MKILTVALSMTSIIFVQSISFAKDVHVNGYYRSNGTYVQPHIRSSPDGQKWNNYGPSNGNGYKSPELRDQDHDGIPNYRDTDDNNNGVHDDNE